MKKARNKRERKQQKQEWPAVVYFSMIGLFYLAYLVSRLMLASLPHQFHWLALPFGLAGTFVGIPLGWQWYRWRGDII